MRKISFLLVFMLVLTGCFEKKTSVVDGSNSEYLEISDFISVDDTGEIIIIDDGSTSGSSIIIEVSTLVPIDKIVTISFTEVIDEQTVDASSVYIIDKDQQPIPSELMVVGNQISIIPNEFFLPGERYTVVITTDVKDIQGRSPEGNILYIFTTVPMTDTTPPTLTSLIPTDGAKGVDKATDVVMTFDENIADNGVTLEVRDSLNVLVTGTNTVSANTLNFNPTSDLEESETYTVTLSGTVEDLSGNVYASISTWSFTVADTIEPTLISVIPADAAVNVNKATDINVTFSENITDNGVTLLIVDSSSAQVAGTNTVSGNTLTFNPTSDLAESETYTVILTGTLEDLSGNVYTGVSTWSFTVADTIAPTLISVVPADAAVNVNKATDINVTFSENIADNGVTLLVEDSLGAPVAGASTVSANTLNFNPTIDLTEGESYTVTLTGYVTDLSGNVYTGVSTWSFTVVSPLVDTTSPILISFTPADGAINVDKFTDIFATFDENVFNGGIILEVRDETLGSIVVPGTDGKSDVLGIDEPSGNIFWFIPTDPLTVDHNYSVLIVGNRANFKDSSGNLYEGPITWSFTVAPLVSPPILTSLTPADGTLNVDRDTDIIMTFDENITNTDDPVVLAVMNDTLGTSVTGTTGVTGNTLWFNPGSALPAGNDYTVSMLGVTNDLLGAEYTGQTSWSFTVELFDIDAVFNFGRRVTVLFSDQYDVSTISANDFEINFGNMTFSDFYASSLYRFVTFVADEDLTAGDIISVSGTIRDTEGNYVNDGNLTDYPL